MATDASTLVREGITNVMIEERGQVAYSTAIALGYSPDDAGKYEQAAAAAVRWGYKDFAGAGRIVIGKRVSGLGGPVYTLSVRGPSGALYDPTAPSSPGNNLGGSD